MMVRWSLKFHFYISKIEKNTIIYNWYEYNISFFSWYDAVITNVKFLPARSQFKI